MSVQAPRSDDTARATSEPAALVKMPFGSPVEDVLSVFYRDGGVILTGVLSDEEVAKVNDEVEGPLESLWAGSRSDHAEQRQFHGDLTKRLTNLVMLSPTFRDALIANPITLDYVRALFEGVCETFWLGGSSVIEILPGEKAQGLHRDAGNYPVFFRYGPSAPEVMCNMITALADITEEMGATRVIPGSHLWENDQPFTPEMTVPVELEAGSAFFYGGKVVHGGGANQTADRKRRVIATIYNPGFLVPEEAYPFTVPIEVARTFSPVVQQMIGFRSFHQRNPRGGPLWQYNYEELADHIGL